MESSFTRFLGVGNLIVDLLKYKFSDYNMLRERLYVLGKKNTRESLEYRVHITYLIVIYKVIFVLTIT